MTASASSPAVLARPVALQEPIRIQLRIIQILSRLEEGEPGWPLALRSQSEAKTAQSGFP